MISIGDREILKILDGPTPLERFVALEEELGAPLETVFIKHDDVLFSGIGGNKARKLEWILGDFKKRGVKNLVTFGAWGSNHVLTTALCAQRFGFKLQAHLSPQPKTREVEMKLEVLKALHVDTVFYASSFSLAIEIIRKRNSPGFIDPGASSSLGILGYVNAYEELTLQLNQKNLSKKNIKIVLPVGTQGTLVGLLTAAALDLGRTKTKIIGVQVVPPHWNQGRLGVLIRTWQELSLMKVKPLLKIRAILRANKILKMVWWSYLPGYGAASQEVQNSLQKWLSIIGAPPLDLTYSAKAMVVFESELKSNPPQENDAVIFWSTYPKYPLEEWVRAQSFT